jgi:homoserine/homoserine lactone efflux protein
MEVQTWLAYVLASLLIAISPGSGAVLAMSHGLAYGMKQTRATIFGLQIGLMVILFIAGAGIGSVLIASETAFNTVKIIGAGYLIYLGWSQWVAKAIPNPDQNEDSQTSNARELTWQQRCITGFLTNVTNPKGIVFMVAVLPQFISPNRPLWPQLIIMAVTMSFIDTWVMSGYAMAASSLQHVFKSAGALKLQNRVFGGILVAVGVGLFFVKRN